MERLYSNLFSSLPMLSVNNAAFANTYVSSAKGTANHLFLFEKKDPVVHVLNEGMRIEDDEIGRFADFIFEKYPSVNVISLHAVECAPDELHLPCQQYPVLEDIVATMPSTAEDYLASLGKSTRSYINRYLNKMRRENPSFKYEVYVKDEIDERDVRELIDIHKARMSGKEKTSLVDEERVKEILQLLKEFGFVVIARVNEKICAGTINYQIGDNYFLETIAHDSNFNDYRIGTICAYLTICECISRSGKEYHFLWGEYDYKFRLGGIKRVLSNIFIYRSRSHVFYNSDIFLNTAFKIRLQHIRKWLHDEASRQDTRTAKVAGGILSLLQKGKRILPSSS